MGQYYDVITFNAKIIQILLLVNSHDTHFWPVLAPPTAPKTSDPKKTKSSFLNEHTKSIEIRYNSVTNDAWNRQVTHKQTVHRPNWKCFLKCFRTTPTNQQNWVVWVKYSSSTPKSPSTLSKSYKYYCVPFFIFTWKKSERSFCFVLQIAVTWYRATDKIESNYVKFRALNQTHTDSFFLLVRVPLTVSILGTTATFARVYSQHQLNVSSHMYIVNPILEWPFNHKHLKNAWNVLKYRQNTFFENESTTKTKHWPKPRIIKPSTLWRNKKSPASSKKLNKLPNCV